jgi:hypothetical protein
LRGFIRTISVVAGKLALAFNKADPLECGDLFHRFQSAMMFSWHALQRQESGVDHASMVLAPHSKCAGLRRQTIV